jgi:hypothetical protein
MEENSIVALNFHPIELEVTFDIGNIFNVTNHSNITRQF